MSRAGPEKQITNAILDALRKRGAFAEKIHGGGMQPRLVDILACYRGNFVAIEVKSRQMQPTGAQRQILEQVDKADGWSACVWSVDQVTALCDEIDQQFDALTPLLTAGGLYVKG